MYDNLHWQLGREIIGDSFSVIPQRLQNVKEVVSRDTGEVKLSGYMDGLQVTVNTGGLYVVGSLCKFLHGSNIYTLNRKTTASAIEKLSDSLGCKVDDASVSYLEFGTSFIMQKPVQEYFKRLGYNSRMHREYYTNLTYKTDGGRRTKIFYDKEKELRQKKVPLPDGFKGLNILRYELRYRQRLPYLLSCPEVKLKTLSDYWFYKEMIDRYQSEYFCIHKQQRLKQDAISKITRPSDAFNVLVAELLSQTDKSKIEAFINDVRDSDVLNHTQLWRLGRMIDKVSAFDGYVEKDELIQEMDDCIKNCSLYI